MQLSKFIATTLIGVLLILGACASPATTPPPTQTPTTPAPATPAPTTPTPATPTAATPTPATPTPATPTPATPAPATPTGPARFVVSDLKVTPTVIEPGDDVAVVSVKVTNAGGQEGTYTVDLKANDQTLEKKSVTLAGGSSQSVTIGVKFAKEGTFTLSVEGLSTVLKVVEGAPGA